MVERQDPQCAPAPQRSAISSTESAPLSTSLLMWRSETTSQWQTIMASGAEQPCHQA